MNYSDLVRAIRGFPVSPSRLRLAYIYSVAAILVLLLFVSLHESGRLPSISRLTTSAGRHTDLSLPDAPFVSWPLVRLCQNTKWTPGIVFACNNNSGGIGNIRNFVLTCLRYAIAAGATGFVLPQIETRSEKDLAHLFGGRQPFSYFFDTVHFTRNLQEACPAITVYDDIESIPHLVDRRAEPLQPKGLGLRRGCDERDLNRHTDMFRTKFDEMVEQSAQEFHLSSVTARHPRLFQPVWGVQWEWPVAKDGPAFTNTFGGLLRLREDILELGKETIAVMTKIAEGGQFAGAHLRTESDALSFWPTFEKQTAEFMKTLSEKKLVSIYIATGNATEAAKFQLQAERRGSRVWTKDKLLQQQPTLQQRLQALTWDQQALVDLIVLLNCNFFLGVSPSSFSMTIAAKRHLAMEDGNGGIVYTQPWPVNNQGDARSRLVGNYSHYWDDWLFMYDALWP
ncbi:hypothetical protein SEUCBS140593_001298 [Sporothrix eucalyptigena]|uniref:Alternative oxidase n=1 Tax=Sporothrix eucalyptigena TaxID=1812306 RepID=A0ABP0AX53_9PEZI